MSKSKKQDRKLMSSSSSQRYEPQSVATLFEIPVSVVRETALEIGKDGKPSRSLKKIYSALEAKGHRKGGNPSPPADTEAPVLSEGDVYVNG